MIVQVQVKNTVKAWSDLYVNFVRLSALVANAEPNIACEELMSSIRSFTDQSPTDVCLSVCVFLSVILCNFSQGQIAYRKVRFLCIFVFCGFSLSPSLPLDNI